MLKKAIKILVIILFTYSISFASRGIERGTEPGEIYIASPWYDSGEDQCTYYGLFYSTDNGETIELKSYSSDPPLPDTVSLIFPYLNSDATPGVLYCRTLRPDLWISYDYGENWELVETYGASMYNAGCVEGEIYRRYDGLYRSDDYGSNFELVMDSIDMVTEIGISPGELYGIKGIYYEEDFKIYYRIDYDQPFIQQCILDSTIVGDRIAGFYPTLSRGTEPGEVYLITWHLPHNYYIYRSTDYGQSFELQYQSEPFPYWIWWVYYTAGREPGSFYVMMHKIDDCGIGTYLKILYSNDYAETFVEYFHHLDGDSFSVDDNYTILLNEIALTNYPNPFSISTTISFNLHSATWRTESPEIKIYNIKGQLVKQFNPPAGGSDLGFGEAVWDGKDSSGKPVPSGVYLYRITTDSLTSETKKMILLK